MPTTPAPGRSLRLPDFLGIGALKAGTSYLETMLRSHPETCMPAAGTELEFFNRHYQRGPAWYAAQFCRCEAPVRGEVSPPYLFDPASPQRIADLLPEVRLLVSVRDPVQRAYSQYKHWVQVTAYPGSFDDFISDHPGAVERGMYFELVSRYLERFRREQLLVVVFEDMVRCPAEVLPQVYAFVGVDPSYVAEAADDAVNASGVPRFHRAYVRAQEVSHMLSDHGAGKLVALAKRTGVARLLKSSTSAPPPFTPLSPATAADLARTYAGDVASLSELLGRDLAAVWPGQRRP
ncbi:MAG: hypothetical protein V7605_996 [Acidimicrobiaceae bacterium]